MKYNLLISVFFCAVLLPCKAQELSVSLSDGSETKTSLTIGAERNLSALLTQIDKAYKTNAKQLSFVGVQISDYAKSILNDALWNNMHFKLCKKEIRDHLWFFQNKMEVRHIPFVLENGKSNRDYQEAIIEFDLNGSILSFAFQNEQTLFESLEAGSRTAEARRQLIIWKWVERLRNAYNEKDTVFLNDFYSDDAVIINGSVCLVKRRNSDTRNVVFNNDVKIKKNYLRKLRIMMKKSDYTFDVRFTAIEDPHERNENVNKFLTKRECKNSYYYGIRFRQQLTICKSSTTFSETGYLFMLWEFPKDENKTPIIHVRTWQPEIVEFDRIYSLTDFSDFIKNQ